MSPGHVRAVVVMNSLKLWLPAQDLHKIKRINIPVRMGRGSRGPTPS